VPPERSGARFYNHPFDALNACSGQACHLSLFTFHISFHRELLELVEIIALLALDLVLSWRAASLAGGNWVYSGLRCRRDD
jgi:hypothetical protein